MSMYSISSLPWALTQEGHLRVETQIGTALLPNDEGPAREESTQTSAGLRSALYDHNASVFLDLLRRWRHQHGAWPTTWNDYFVPYVFGVWASWCTDDTFVGAIHKLMTDLCENPGPIHAMPPERPKLADGPARKKSPGYLKSVKQAEKCVERQDLAGAITALCKAMRDLASSVSK